jgi:hypothetical protein
MTFNIPDVGDQFKLISDWTFTLYNEQRNKTLFEAFNIDYDTKYYKLAVMPSHTVTLPVGTVLKIDRVYIRKGASDYSSLSFFIKKHNDKDFVGKRFWAKLSDVNTIQFNIAPSTKKNPIIKVEAFINRNEIYTQFTLDRSIYSFDDNTPDIFKIKFDPNDVLLEYYITLDGVLAYKTILSNIVIEKTEQTYGTWLFKNKYTNFILKDFTAETIDVNTNEVISKARTLDSIKLAIQKHIKK